MLIRAKISETDKNITIYRRGLGITVKLLNLYDAISDSSDPKRFAGFVNFVLRKFTNIRYPFLYRSFHPKNPIGIINEVIKFNLPSNDGKKTSEKISYERLVASYADTLMSNYSMPLDYILTELDFIQASELIDEIFRRKKTDAENQVDTIKILTKLISSGVAYAFNAPAKLTEYYNELDGGKNLSLEESVELARKIVEGKKNG